MPETIRAVHRGEWRLQPSVARKVMEPFWRPPTPMAGEAAALAPGAATAPGHDLDEALTEKEARVLQLIAEASSNQQIGATVRLAEGTVKHCVSRNLDKLQTGSRAELTARASNGAAEAA